MTDTNPPAPEDPRLTEKETVTNDALAGEPVEGGVEPDPETVAETQDPRDPEFVVNEDGEVEPVAENPELTEHSDDDVILGTDAVDSRSDGADYPPVAETDDREPSEEQQTDGGPA
ncbi:hypothetical protein [Paramicrobacterium agarici]|uniref:Uncharacterized protein n=1 Tax=Paramicrobacterium agarici TaxID=630514 RepID=A0A2A9DW61_9MICO|nr:hypothetical protein [Microbacterium agarici]PFG30149.1 hypothetical protein ATJ78_1071 [Microbacterium agarici]TQO23157.1 hypothetical protein FB385_2003 [Microbacterium agarici]